MQIIQLSTVLIRTILIIYTIFYKDKDIYPLIVMILMPAIVYIVTMPSKAIFETINMIAQAIVVYFINVLYNYRIDVSNANYIQQVEITLSIFLLLYVAYFFLKNIEDIIKPKEKGKKKNEKR